MAGALIMIVIVIIAIPFIMIFAGYRRPTGNFIKGVVAYDIGDYKTARMEFSYLADHGNAKSQFYVGLMYENGFDYLQDYKWAFKWYKRAAEKGHVDAQNKLGMFYYNGWGVLQNYEEAIKWFILAAEQDQILAQACLSAMYANGDGVPQDFILAYMWADIAISNGEAISAKIEDAVTGEQTPEQVAEESAKKIRDIATLELTTEQITKAKKLAEEWLIKNNTKNLTTASDTSAPADDCNNDQDDAKESDYKKARMELIRFAEQGDAEAQHSLGWIYNDKNDTMHDYNQAVKWYTLAAEQGFAPAQFSLAVSYLSGKGVTQDNVLALMWLKLSILDSSGNMKAFREGMKNDLESMMLPEQITETENMVQEWLLNNNQAR